MRQLENACFGDIVNNGILSWGGYVPGLRLERKAIVEANGWANGALAARARGHRSFCNWDEDALTMGVEAGRACLARAAQPADGAADPRAVPAERLVFASTTPPFQDRPSAVLAAAALQLPDVHGLDHGGSQRAGASALLDAMDREASSLVIAADTRHASPGTLQEMLYGDGAAAILVGRGAVAARFLGGASQGVDFVGHFRAAGQNIELYWEERWIRDEGIGKIVPQSIETALGRARVTAGEIHHFIFPTLLPRAAEQIAAILGIPDAAVRDNLAGETGETGTAHALLMLAATLDAAKPGEKVLIASFGHGCDVLLFEVTDAITVLQLAAGVVRQLTAGAVERSYQKFLSFKGEVKIDFGLRFEAEVRTQLTAQYRRGAEMAAFIAGRCSRCGAVQFPRAGVCVNAECDAVGAQTPVSLFGEGAEIVSFTADWLSFKGAPPFCFGLVQFDNGARVLMELVDFSAEQLRVGARVRLVYRKKEIDTLRHYHSYFWKAAPAL
jgi:hydroxymethylglutaryl-CoA synthase